MGDWLNEAVALLDVQWGQSKDWEFWDQHVFWVDRVYSTTWHGFCMIIPYAAAFQGPSDYAVEIYGYVLMPRLFSSWMSELVFLF